MKALLELRFCEAGADSKRQFVWRSGYLILPLLHCTTNILSNIFHWFILEHELWYVIVVFPLNANLSSFTPLMDESHN